MLPPWPTVASAFDRVAEPLKDAAHAIAHLTLQLDPLLGHRAAGSALALEPLAQVLQKGIVPWQAEHHRDGLATAPLLLHPQLGNDAGRHGAAVLLSCCCTCTSVEASRRPGTCHPSRGVDGADIVVRAHRSIIVETVTFGYWPLRILEICQPTRFEI